MIRELALFAGAGGGLLASLLLGIRTVCAVEIDPYARDVLRARQSDGVFESFEIHEDVKTFSGSKWRGTVDLVSGGFPCQDISVAGRGAGIDGARSGLWSEYARIVEEVEPALVFAENSPAIRSRGLGRVLRDLSALGFDAEWTYLGADDVGAPHRRKRFWLLAAHPDRVSALQSRRREPSRAREAESCGDGDAQPLADSDVVGREGAWPTPGPREQRPVARDASGAVHGSDADVIGRETRQSSRRRTQQAMADADGARQLQPSGSVAEQRGRTGDGRLGERDGPWTFEPDVGRVAHGVAARSHRLRCIGNGQVPLVAAVAFVELARRLGVEGVAMMEVQSDR